MTELTNASQQAAAHFRHIHFGGNWTITNLKDTLSSISWEDAQKKVGDHNSIAALAVHVYYFIPIILNVYKGEPLKGKDSESFDHSFIQSQKDWEDFLENWWNEAEEAASLIEKYPEEKLYEEFFDAKYGNWYRQIHGIIEHTHYHLGQISLIRKLIK